MRDLNLLNSLIANDSIRLNVKAKDWQDAITKAFEPLIKSGAIKAQYIDRVIKLTIKLGPYYIISDNVAMPHGRPEDGVIKDAFSLITLAHPVKFDGDERAIKVLIALGATSADIHVSSALPQIVAVFESATQTQKIVDAKSQAEIIAILKAIDISKYTR